MNNALKTLLDSAKKDGAIKSSETTKQNIYQSKYFEGVITEKEEKKIRRNLRDLAINYLSLIAGAKDKKSFDLEYKKFERFFKDTYISEKVDFSVFDTLRRDSYKKIVAGAIANFNKWSK